MKFTKFMAIFFLLCTPVYAEEKETPESGVTSRIVLEKEIENSPFELDMEMSFEAVGNASKNISYGSLAFGWHPDHESYLALGVGAGEMGFPMQKISPLFTLEGERDFEVEDQIVSSELEIEYFPVMGTSLARFEMLVSSKKFLEDLHMGLTMGLKNFREFQMGPEIQFPLYGMGEVTISDSISMEGGVVSQNARFVLEKQF